MSSSITSTLPSAISREAARSTRRRSCRSASCRAPGLRLQYEVEPIDPKAGHVPRALNRPFSDNLDASGRFKSAAHLRGEFYALIGAFQPWQVVHMCGSGVTACHNLLAMEAAGMQGSRVFAPSWSGWISTVATNP